MTKSDSVTADIDPTLTEGDDELARIDVTNSSSDSIGAIHDAVSTLVDRVAFVEARLSTLIKVLGGSSGMSQVSEEEYRDMAIIIDSQAKIIQAMVSEHDLPEESRRMLADTLAQMSEFELIEQAKARIDERNKQRKILEADSDE